MMLPVGLAIRSAKVKATCIAHHLSLSAGKVARWLGVQASRSTSGDLPRLRRLSASVALAACTLHAASDGVGVHLVPFQYCADAVIAEQAEEQFAEVDARVAAT